MTILLDRLLGPRVDPAQFREHPVRYGAPVVLLLAARVLLLVSIFLPYWHMELDAPQYPDGLYLTAYVNHLAGDVKEIDGLNHYIGMRPLDQAAAFERAASIWLIIAMVLLVEAAAVVHSPLAVLLALPAIAFPAAFIVDLRMWLAAFGQNLDPEAPLSSAVKPFIPAVLGEGGIGQFKTYASLGTGYWLAVACAGLTVAGFYFHRRAYKPLFDHARAGRAAPGGST